MKQCANLNEILAVISFLIIWSTSPLNAEPKVDHLIPVRSAVFSPLIIEGDWLDLRKILESEVPSLSKLVLVDYNTERRSGIHLSVSNVNAEDPLSGYQLKIVAFKSNHDIDHRDFINTAIHSFPIQRETVESLEKVMKKFVFSTKQVPETVYYKYSPFYRFYSYFIGGVGEIHGTFPNTKNVSEDLQELADFSDWFWYKLFSDKGKETDLKLTEEDVMNRIQMFIAQTEIKKKNSKDSVRKNGQ